ncbi:hypothetical protein D9611_007752 [Ephemerocybe angulata]|uniref:Uncharacterized protein n=1 Tax=Ephemerocybe angulata TaxID=980116 RepID=A0A8H5FCC0_9AGAR|nr:hypothetical protein D9611_007752 [Tulosesus angulatus]
MSDTLSDVTAVMGEFMLKGWVLTDKACPTRGCAVPLMRSPRGQSPEVYFCAKCNGSPNAPAHSEPEIATQEASEVSSATSKSRGSSTSRSSTPLTEVSNGHDDEEFVLPPETEESRRRRAQSDRASTEIGARLLKGWAMLGEECPNDTCYGIPLVRPPSQGGEKDPRKECVICGNVYLPEAAQLPVSEAQPTAGNKAGVVGDLQKERLASPQGQQTEATFIRKEPSLSSTFLPPPVGPSGVEAPAGDLSALNTAAHALQTSLNVLSARMTSLASSSSLDVAGLGNAADAIGKVVQALSQVKSMQWSEAQAHNL